MPSLKLQIKQPDFSLILTVLFLLLLGIFLIYDASPVFSKTFVGDPYYFLKNQLVFMGIGLGLALFLTFFDYHKLKNLSIPLLFVSLIFLFLILLPGIGTEIFGAKRWINLGPVSFQPSELIKFSLIIFLAAYFAKSFKARLLEPKLLPFLGLVGIIIGLILAEPDFGTAATILGISFLIYFVSGGQILKILAAFPLLAILGTITVLSSPYRLARLKTFFDPSIDPQGISYHMNQILIALSNGGIFGAGVGQSRQKFAFLPTVHTDSIFAVLAEEFGFLGGAIFIILVAFLLWRIFSIAKCAPDDFGRFLALGIGVWIGFQTIVNLATMVAILPITGVPLPFISYGGSAIVLTLAAFGILLNISKQRVLTK